jgi:hypothetical protein
VPVVPVNRLERSVENLKRLIPQPDPPDTSLRKARRDHPTARSSGRLAGRGGSSPRLSFVGCAVRRTGRSFRRFDESEDNTEGSDGIQPAGPRRAAEHC